LHLETKGRIDASLPKLFQSEGNVIESREIPVWDVRQRARQDCHKLRGDYPVERKHYTFEGSLPVVSFTPEEESEVKAKMELLKQKS